MKRWIFGAALAVALAAPSFAQVIRLYLKDGSYQLAREYQVLSDRVKFFSTDRGAWEEIPLDLVDLKKTEATIKEHKEEMTEAAKADAAEEKAERQQARQISSIPMETGAYLIQGDKVVPMKIGEVSAVNNKRRSILKAISPVPMVSGKSTMEMDGPHSQTVVNDTSPEFYIRLSEDERFGIVKMGEHKGNRVVEKVTVVPVTGEYIEEPDLVPVYRQQVQDMVYKIWPQKPLAPGEYAVVEYTEGKVNIQTWDFRVAGGK